MFVFIMYALVNLLFRGLGFASAGVMAVCVLKILVASVIASNCLYDITNSFLDMFLFYFFLARPEVSFGACTINCPIAFFVVLVSSMLAKTLTTGLGARTGLSARLTFHARVLFSASHLLRGTGKGARVLSIAYARLLHLLGHGVATCMMRGKALSRKGLFSKRGRSARSFLVPRRRRVTE